MTSEVIRRQYELAREIFDREEARREGVERQAMTLLGITGLISSLWMGLGQSLLTYSQKQYVGATVIMSVIFAATLVAFLNTLIFSLLALRRLPFHTFFPDEVSPHVIESEDAYLVRMTRERLLFASKNFAKTDWKVRHLKRAQRAFYAGIFAILMGGSMNIYLAVSNLVEPWMIDATDTRPSVVAKPQAPPANVP